MCSAKRKKVQTLGQLFRAFGPHHQQGAAQSLPANPDSTAYMYMYVHVCTHLHTYMYIVQYTYFVYIRIMCTKLMTINIHKPTIHYVCTYMYVYINYMSFSAVN